jgi:hypothetical protein
MDKQLGCTEEESASLMQNSNEAAKAQGLDALSSYGGRGKSAAAAASMIAAIVTSLLM